MLEKKTDELTDMRNLVSFHRSLWNALPWLPLFNSFAICTRRIEQFQRSMNCDMKCLQKRMCLDRLPPTLDALVMVAALGSSLVYDSSLSLSVSVKVT